MKTLEVYELQDEFITCKLNLFIIGQITYEDSITPGLVWHLTNYSCWAEENEDDDWYHMTFVGDEGAIFYPNPNARGYTNHNICFEINNIWYCADSWGFSTYNSFIEALNHLYKTNLVII